MGDEGSWKVIGIAIAAFFLLAGIGMTLVEDFAPQGPLVLASQPAAPPCAPDVDAPTGASADAASPCAPP